MRRLRRGRIRVKDSLEHQWGENSSPLRNECFHRIVEDAMHAVAPKRILARSILVFAAVWGLIAPTTPVVAQEESREPALETTPTPATDPTAGIPMETFLPAPASITATIEQLRTQSDGLAQREAELNQREAELDAESAALEEAENILTERSLVLEQNQAILAEREALLERRQQLLLEREQELEALMPIRDPLPYFYPGPGFREPPDRP